LSARTLVQKLGIKPGWRAALIHPPEDYVEKLLEMLPSGTVLLEGLERGLPFAQGFFYWRTDLEHEFPILAAALAREGMLWVCWPKRSAGLPGDLNENGVREIGLAAGLVDVKVIAVDAVWSGLKFVFRRAGR
jgi:hypothetical protein